VILVDTSVWIDHLRKGDAKLAALLETDAVLMHPFVLGEIALGHLRQREIVLGALADLAAAGSANDAEVFYFINRHRLFGCGIGYVDAHLLAAAWLTPGLHLWTKDRRLHDVAVELRLPVAP